MDFEDYNNLPKDPLKEWITQSIENELDRITGTPEEINSIVILQMKELLINTTHFSSEEEWQKFLKDFRTLNNIIRNIAQ
jgi:hypothetical protein